MLNHIHTTFDRRVRAVRNTPARRGTHATHATAGNGAPALFGLPLFPLRNCLHPTAEGQVHVFEQQYLQMFKDIQAKSAAGSDRLRFGHIMSREAAPAPLLEDTIGGLPRTGCVAEIQEVVQRADGSMVVRYRGLRRFRTLSMWQTEPYQVACSVWYDDEPTEAQNEATLHALEADLYSVLRRVASLTKAVAPAGEVPPGLPEAVLRYAPPSQVQKTVATYLKQAGHPAGSAISMYLRHGSVYGRSQLALQKAQDPYQIMREQVGGGHRRELFSFAAASMLEMGQAERLALLQSQDSAARLQWVLEAVRPTLQQLQAHATMVRAVKGAGSGN